MIRHRSTHQLLWILGLAGTFLAACAEPPRGLAKSPAGAGPTVIFDFHRRPLPEIPMPNDLATRPDPTSPTGLRINASTVAATEIERTARQRIDELSGWGAYQFMSVSFDAPVDMDSVMRRHRDYASGDGSDYDFRNDAIFLVDVTLDSPTFQQPVPIDLGEGNFPMLLRTPHQYWEHDPKTHTKMLALETYEEDWNDNGELDPGEDIDMDGILDHPNLHPAQDGDRNSVDPVQDLVSSYEFETNTLLFKPIIPLRERTRYAVVITTRVTGLDGEPAQSPFEFVNHTEQTDDLRPVEGALAGLGLGLEDVAFTWSFTVQDTTSDMVKLRNGMYRAGPLAWLAEDNPPELTYVQQMVDLVFDDGSEREPCTADVTTKCAPENPYIVTPDQLKAVVKVVAELVFGDFPVDQLLANLDYYAYHVSGRFRSPWLLDLPAGGNLDRRAWPADLEDPTLRDRIQDHDRYHEVQFLCSIPKDEYKHDPAKPAPVVLYAHGYGSNKMESFVLALYGKFGIAVCSIDAVGHGVDVEDNLVEGRVLLAANGLLAMEDVLFGGRARDLDNDGFLDPGADFFTAYMFRTRDNLRQTLVDWLHLVRLLRGFGTGTMRDLDGDSVPETLGDFNADGVPDLGGDGVPFFASGTSLGGLISSQLSGIEPKIVAAAPIAGGAGLVDLSVRSEQVGVVDALMLRLGGPHVVGEPTGDGRTRIYQLVANENEPARRTVAIRSGIEGDDVVMVTNLRSGDSRCARVMPELPPPGYEDYVGYGRERNCAPNDPEGTCRDRPDDSTPVPGCEDGAGSYGCDLALTFRVGIPSDDGDPLRVDFFGHDGDVSVDGQDRRCDPRDGALPYTTVDTFEVPVRYKCVPPETERGPHPPSLDIGDWCREFGAGDALVSLEDGFGFQRATPTLRRFSELAQMVVEPADPATWAVHYSRDRLTFMEGEDEVVAPPTNVLNVSTIGDANVPINTGVAISKVAGFIELHSPRTDQGKTVNRVLIDEGVQQGIPWLSVRGDEWGPVLVDVDVLSGCANGPMEVCGEDGLVAPRLVPPLRIVLHTPGTDNGKSGIVFPISDEFDGMHGFAPPGISNEPFDVGQFMSHQLGWYFQSAGTAVRYDRCMGEGISECDFIPDPPPGQP